MQELIVFVLFIGIIAHALVRRFWRKEESECSSCAFNQESAHKSGN
jgi:hypothetical protein